MFESIQDYLSNEIDKEELYYNIIHSKQYVDSSNLTKSQLDLFIEELKDIKDENKFIKMITNNDYFVKIGIPITEIDIFNLATRTCKGPIPILEPPILYGFLDAAIEKKDDERIFRLVYNYDNAFFDKTEIEDYFIKNKNAFYINELACNDISNINIDKLANALIKIENLEELKYFVNNVYDKNYDKTKVINKIKELENPSR